MRSPRPALAVAIAMAALLPACRKRPGGSPRLADDAAPAVSAAAASAGPLDAAGDPLPTAAVARLGSLRFLDRRLENMVFASGGKQLVSSAVKGYSIWDAASGRRVGELDQSDPGPALAAAPGGTIVATAISGRGKLQVWDLPRRATLVELAPGREVDALCFIDDDTLVSGSDGLVVVWAVSRAAELRRFPAASTDLSALACARGGVIAWGDDAGSVWTATLGNDAEPVTLGDAGKRITSLALDVDGTRVAAGIADGSIRIWTRATPAAPVVIQAHDQTVASVAWAGDVLWSSGGDAWLRSWQPDGVLIKEIEAIAGLSRQYLAVAPDGIRAATWALHRGAKGSEAGRFWLWSLSTGDVAAEPERHAGALTAVTFSPDGAHIATASEDNAVRLWDLPGGKAAAVFTAHEGPVNALSFSRDGATLYSAGSDAYLYGWRWATDKGDKFIGPIGGEVNAFALPGDKGRLVTGDEVGRVWSWDLATGARLQAHDRGTYTSITGVAIGRDHRTLAITGSERVVLIVDLESGAELARLEPDVVSNFAVAFSPDGALLATAGDDGRVRLWDTATWKPARALEGHDGSVRCLSFSADGKRLASGGNDATVRLWQVEDGKELANFEGHSGAVTGIALSPDGAWLASASQDRTGLIWKVP